MKYKTKPVIIEAIKWTGDNTDKVLEFTNNLAYDFSRIGWDNISIPTLEGAMIANRGDYIIKGLKGEFYPCKPDIFEMKYEAVED